MADINVNNNELSKVIQNAYKRIIDLELVLRKIRKYDDCPEIHRIIDDILD